MRLIGHSARQRLAFQEALPLPVSARPPMTNTKGSTSGLFRVPVPASSWATRGVAVFAWPRGAGGCRWARLGDGGRPRMGRGTRFIAARPTDATGESGRTGWPTGRPIRTVHRVTGLHGRERRVVPRRGTRARGQVPRPRNRPRHGPSCAYVRGGALRPSFQPEPGEHIPARDPARYWARNAGARARGGLQHGRRVATRYAPYAQRCLGLLYRAGAWIWMKSNLNTA